MMHLRGVSLDIGDYSLEVSYNGSLAFSVLRIKYRVNIAICGI